jgi:TetR/AcrR family transcriptional regulator, transcriptional repressor of bet genes
MTVDTVPSVTTRRTAPKEQRRQELIEATMETIADRGLAGTTLAEVTGRAGLSLGLANHHFTSKENLLTATLRHLAVELRALWVTRQADPHLTAAEKLRAIVEGMFDPAICTPTKIAVWFAFFGDAHYRSVYRAIVAEFDTERSDVIEALCRTLARQDGRSDIDPLALAQSIETLADGLWLSLMLYPTWVTPSQAIDRIIDLLAMKFPDHFNPSAPRDPGPPASAG